MASLIALKSAAIANRKQVPQEIRNQETVTRKPGTSFTTLGVLPQSRCQSHRRYGSDIAGGRASNDFDQGYDRNRVEKMHAHEILGPLQGR